MRTLKLHFSEDALPTLETFLKRTKEARVFRRAQAVRAVVTGHRLQTVSDTLHFTYSALRKWVYRFATQGPQGLVDRSEEHTSELQSPYDLVCRLLLEKNNTGQNHGCCVPTAASEVEFMCTAFYVTEGARAFAWNDPAVRIACPLTIPL